MEDLVLVSDFCTCHKIENSFINSLHQSGLVKITTIEETSFIPLAELPALEKLVRLHEDLDLNPAALEVVSNLLQRIEEMQNEIGYLKSRLQLYQASI